MDEYSKLSDIEIVELVTSKDPEIFREIVQRYQSKLFSYVVIFVQDDDIARDIIQSTFMKAYVNLNGFDKDAKFSSWIYRIAHNEALNTKKRWRREISIEENELDISDGNIQMEEQMLYEEKTILKDCISSLPEKYSSSLILFYIEEKSYEEISDVLQLSTSTIGTRIRRGRLMLKNICKKINQ